MAARYSIDENRYIPNVMIDMKRFTPNNLPEYKVNVNPNCYIEAIDVDEDDADIRNKDVIIASIMSDEFRKQLLEIALRLTKYLIDNQDSEIRMDTTIYTGSAGIVYLLAWVRSVLTPETAEYDFVNTALQKQYKKMHEDRHAIDNKARKNQAQSPFTGAIGVFLVQLLIKIDEDPDEIALALKKYVKAHDAIRDPANLHPPNEILYGRAGYLAGLVCLKQAGYEIDNQIFIELVDTIVRRGRELSNDFQRNGTYTRIMNRPYYKHIPPPPLMYTWHDKVYLGGAHGFAGILLTLLNCHSIIPDCIPSETQIFKDIIATIKWMISLQYESGNWPSSLSERANLKCQEEGADKLVQWCHGAPGILPLLVLAYNLTGDKVFLHSAKKASLATWKRGLLTKGCGLCHGVAGNAYALTYQFQMTGRITDIWRVKQFAIWCCEPIKHQDTPADTPYSLFEGLAGTIYFLIDLYKDHYKAGFPFLSPIYKTPFKHND